VTNGVGGGPRDDRGAGRYAPSQADLRDPVGRARAARELRGEGGGRGRGVRSLGLLAGCLIVAGASAIVILVLATTLLRPIVGGWVTGMAYDSPSLLGIGWISDLVKADLGSALTERASANGSEMEFTVERGDTAAAIADRLHAQGLLADPRAFVFLAVSKGLSTQFEAGAFVLRKDMTPDQLVASLLETKVFATTIALRNALRLEQVAAYLQTLSIKTDVKAFYDLAKKPPASLVADYPFLADLPKGASLEGYLASGVYEVDPRIDAEALLRRLLDGYAAKMGDRLTVPASRRMTLHELDTLASIVDREAVVDSEYAKIAGVYQNRLDAGMILNADPTVIYGVDTTKVTKLPFAHWPSYAFWNPVGTPLADVTLPKSLASYQTYVNAGLPAGPIVTPSVKAMDAALKPDTSGGYIYFVAIPDGGGKHAFAKTYEQHLANLKKYGYIQ